MLLLHREAASHIELRGIRSLSIRSPQQVRDYWRLARHKCVALLYKL
jgi:hypothetical protein